MNIKDSIGLRIKTERERQQMSREVLCLDGAELTVRQLIRIEKGESLPSLDKLSYIAKRLGKNMTDLLDHDNITIPDEYYEMKNRLIKFPTYRNPERIKAKLALIEEVYEKFFELLPEEELLTLDILENILSFTSWEESPKVEEIYEDLFEQVKRKKKFSTNDLLVIDYYFFHLYGRKQYDKKLFERIVKGVLNQEIWTDDVYNIVLFNDLMAVSYTHLDVYKRQPHSSDDTIKDWHTAKPENNSKNNKHSQIDDVKNLSCIFELGNDFTKYLSLIHI